MRCSVWARCACCQSTNDTGSEVNLWPMAHSIARAKELGYPAVVLAGNPDYYSRFGFAAAKRYGIANQEGKHVDYLLALELVENGMEGIGGRFCDDEAFHSKAEELVEFEKAFPAKEKHITSTQLKMDI